MSVMKHREGSVLTNDLGDGRLSDQGKDIKKGGSGGGGFGRMPEGLFDSFWPSEKACWIHVTPHQAWEQFVYDRDSGTVIRVKRTWYQTTKHYDARTKRSLICSAGPHRTEPCYPDALRRAFWAEMNAIEERTGVKPKDEAPLGTSNQFSFSIVVMENILAIPLRDKQTGEARKSRAGKIIYNYKPEPMVAPLDRTNLQKTFGRRFHLSVGKTHLLMILQFDEEMKNYCKHCAHGLTADAVICPDCETPYALPGLVGGEDLVDTRQLSYNCSTCSYEGEMQPRLTCAGCGNAEEGRLTDFDIRLKKEMIGEKQSILKIVGVRKPLSTITDPAVRAEVEKMILNPLDITAIFAPTPIADQKKILGNRCTGIDPRQPKKDDESGGGDVEEFGHPDEEGTDIPFEQ